MKLKEIKKLLHLQTLEKIQDYYSTALGIPIAIRNAHGEQLTKMSNVSRLWEIIHKRPEVEANYNIPLQDAIDKCNRTGQIVIFERVPDAYAFIAPIHTNGQIVAFFIGGLVRFGNPNMMLGQIQADILGIDLDTYLDAYLNLSFITEESLEASAHLIKIIGNTISSLEMEDSEIKVKANFIQQQNQQLSQNLNKTNQELIKSNNRYKQIFDTVNDGIYAADLEKGTIIEINQAGAQIFGFSHPDQIKGKDLKTFYANPAERDELVKILKEKGTIQHWIANIISNLGEAKTLETNGNVFTDEITGKALLHGVFRELNPRIHRPISA